MEKLKKIIKILLKTLKIIFIVFAVSVISFVLIQRISNNKVSIFGYRMFTVITGSMEPVYSPGDVLFSKIAKTENLKIGDDVVYLGKVGTFENKIVTHRIIDIITKEEKTEFLIKGVANSGVDPIVQPDQILGKIVLKSQLMTMLTKFISHPIGFIIIFFVPIAYIAITTIYEKIKGDDDEELEILDLD